MEDELRLRLEGIKVQEQETVMEYVKDLVSVLQLETKGEMEPEKLFRQSLGKIRSLYDKIQMLIENKNLMLEDKQLSEERYALIEKEYEK